MAQETLDRASRLADEAGNVLTKLDLVHEAIRHLLDEHKAVNPKLQATLRRAKTEYDRKLRRLIRALDGEKR